MKYQAIVTFITLALLAISGAKAQSLREVVKRVSSTVVIVHADALPPNASATQELNTTQGLGSGVLIADGRVLTAAHVVESADRLRVQYSNGTIVSATVVSADPVTDVTLLQVSNVPLGVSAARIGDSDRVEVADQVFVIGAPYGIGDTLSIGHISARRLPQDESGGGNPVELFQTDAAVAPGNSGGPMFNMNGEVIGIVSHIVTRSGGSEGIAFAVTSKVVSTQLLDAPALWTGLSVVPLRGELARLLNLPQRAGLLVVGVAKGSVGDSLGLLAGRSPAAIGGVKLMLGGDIILEVGGVAIDANANDYRRARERLRLLKPGQTVAVTVLRGGRRIDLLKAFP